MKDNDKIGILKSFDKLGRIVIPKELRERFSLSDNVEIIATTDGILIKNPEYELVRNEKTSPSASPPLSRFGSVTPRV